MSEWLGQASEMYYYDLEVMASNPGWVELKVHNTSLQLVLELKISIASASVQLCI